MVSVRDVAAADLVSTAAEELKKSKDFTTPEWSLFVRTGLHAKRAPQDPEWWHTRVASVFRRIYLDGPVGVQRLRTYFGGRYRRGMRPAIEARASGKIIRVVVQQLEKAGYLEKGEKSGRNVSKKGKSFLDKVATKINKEKPLKGIIEMHAAKYKPLPAPVVKEPAPAPAPKAV